MEDRLQDTRFRGDGGNGDTRHSTSILLQLAICAYKRFLLTDYLRAMARFQRYSLGNILEIARNASQRHTPIVGDVGNYSNTDTIKGMEEAMPTRNINLTLQMDRFVEEKIRNGQYANASEVIRAGLRTLEGDEREKAAKIDAWRKAIDTGEARGLAKGDVISRLRTRIRQRVEATGAIEK